MAGKKDTVKDSERFTILQPNFDTCFFCGKRGELQIHEVIHGTANRKKSKEDGMCVSLCERCHTAVHNMPEVDEKLKTFAEKMWLEKYTEKSMAYEERINLFISRYGKNYIEFTEE